MGLALIGCTDRPAKQDAQQASPEAETDVASEITGVAVVVDGDTIRIGERQIRFDGIDAPEEGAMCGETNMDRAATNALSAITRNHRVVCRITVLPDQYGRDIAQCRAGEMDLSAYMVANGWARDWPRYSDGAYADEEAEARAAARGVWGPTCEANLWSAGRDYSPIER
jgi:endonuclease YncB( thermonuclease family)